MTLVAPPALFDAPDQRAAETDVCRSALMELVEIGMELARMVRDEANGEAADAAVAFDRVARAVRRTVRLKQWLDQPVPSRADAADGGSRVAARAQIIRAVEDKIDRAADAREAELLHAELLERLDGPDIDDDIGRRPTGEIIADICRDLGVDNWPGTRPWVRRRPADVAALHARAAAVAGATRDVGGPLVRLGVRDAPGREGQPGGGCRDGPDLETLAVMLARLGQRG